MKGYKAMTINNKKSSNAKTTTSKEGKTAMSKPKATATAKPTKATATAKPTKATATAKPKATATAKPKATATAKPKATDMIIEMYHVDSKFVCEGTYQSFVKNNADDEDTIEALTKLKNGASEVKVAVGQGYNLLKVKK